MFFHIDESGNTGNNLFDPNQPILSYGVLSCRTNVDVLCRGLHKQILKVIDDDQIHANLLGVGGLVKIAPLLMQIQQKMKFDFDYYFIHKPTFAVVTFFDAVFDTGLNKAVPWHWYWTPLRYLLVASLARILDENLLKESWRLCTVKNIQKHKGDIVTLLKAVKTQTEQIESDTRGREIIVDALDFGIANPLELDFGVPDQKMLAPNAVAFQFVASAMANKVRKKGQKRASSILVDRQSQFNKSQAETHRIQALISEGMRKAPQQERDWYLKHPLHTTLECDQLMHRALIDNELTVSSSSESIGLQIVDAYLWMANKILGGEDMPPELLLLHSLFLRKGLIDGISIEGMAQRYHRFLRLTPEFGDLKDDQIKMVERKVEEHRAEVQKLKSGK